MTNSYDIFKKIKKEAIKYRKPIWLSKSPRIISEDTAYGNSRLKIILSNYNCSRHSCTMCPLPNYRSISKLSALQQLEILFKMAEQGHPSELAIYNDGSFFGPEISEDIRDFIALRVSKLNVKKLSVESLPNYLVGDHLKKFSKKLKKGIKVEISIGLQTFSDGYRKILLGSQFDRKCYELAVSEVSEHEFSIRVHILTPLPLLTRKENLKELIKTIIYLSKSNINLISICLLRPQPYTLVGKWHEEYLILPPWPELILQAQYMLRLMEREDKRFKFDGIKSFTCGTQSFPWAICNKCWRKCLRIINGDNGDTSEICEYCQKNIELVESCISKLGNNPIARADAYLKERGEA